MEKEFIGKKVLVRSVEAGVYFGTLKEMEGSTVRLTDVRNIWSWEGASCLSQIANDGIKSGRVGPIVGEMVILGVCQLLPLTDKALENLNDKPAWIY